MRDNLNCDEIVLSFCYVYQRDILNIFFSLFCFIMFNSERRYELFIYYCFLSYKCKKSPCNQGQKVTCCSFFIYYCFINCQKFPGLMLGRCVQKLNISRKIPISRGSTKSWKADPSGFEDPCPILEQSLFAVIHTFSNFITLYTKMFFFFFKPIDGDYILSIINNFKSLPLACHVHVIYIFFQN